MKIFDVTMPIHAGMVVYKDRDEHRPSIEKVRTIEQGSNESRISLYSHSGTHVDAPYHMMEDGYKLENIPLDKLYGKCMVVSLENVMDCIRQQDLEKYAFEAGTFVFLKTKNSQEDYFNPEFVYLAPDAAEYLVAQKIKVLGIDALSVERDCAQHATHGILMREDTLVVEGLRLKDVPEGLYKAVIAPLPIVGGDGCPARVLLVDEE